jgi:AAA+ superfamily predicted ATPase
MHGASGTGKSLLLNALRTTVQSAYSVTTVFDVRTIIDILRATASLADVNSSPLLITIDNMSWVTGGEDADDAGSDASRAMCALLDAVAERGTGVSVCLVAALVSAERLPAHVRRRFHVEVQMGIPNDTGWALCFLFW